MPPRHAHEAARAERRGRAHARRLRGVHRRPGRAGRPAAAAGRTLRRRRAARSAPRRCSAAATSTSSCSGICAAIRKTTTTRSSAWPTRFACRWSPPAACALPRPRSGRSSTSSRAIREHTTLDAAGRRLAANAERYLKPPAQMARLFADRPEAVRESLALAERLQFTMKDLGYRFPRYPVPPGETEMLVPPQDHRRRRARSLSAVSRQGARADCARARSHREARARRLLPHRLGHRQLLPPAGHPRAGPRIGGQ